MAESRAVRGSIHRRSSALHAPVPREGSAHTCWRRLPVLWVKGEEEGNRPASRRRSGSGSGSGHRCNGRAATSSGAPQPRGTGRRAVLRLAAQVGNIKASLAALSSLGVSVDGVSARDVRDGSLRAVLALLFALSRYKQQQKQQRHVQHQHAAHDDMPRLPAPFSKQQQQQAHAHACD
ncbi:uncharacterized protein LOC124722726 [Schistocerca piceifrons]|uniref:uncharacterized protein LOC124722726 n=1 Tax=Schistocerca piceifrons TaxID=274613 RepID=UPI001F5FB2ED|nr:uncharacterized protein LOC124722726 [Schistocerca piceifrons]